jgi:hypothetical protein
LRLCAFALNLDSRLRQLRLVFSRRDCPGGFRGVPVNPLLANGGLGGLPFFAAANNLKAEIRMTEGRKKPEIRRPKPPFATREKKYSRRLGRTRIFRASGFGFLSAFGFRASDFGFNSAYPVAGCRWTRL